MFHSPYQSKDGFTLIELLAVLGILAVLAVLLLPTLKRFQEKGKETECISNLRQIGGAIASYAADNDNQLPVNNSDTGGLRWYLMLNPYLGKDATSANGGWKAPSVFICPTNDPHEGDGGTGRFKLWLDFGYMCNLALMPRYSAGSPPSYYPNPPIRMATLPQNRVLVADVGMNSRSQFLKSTANALPYGGDVERAHVHSGGVNVLWTNFSVSRMKAEEIVSDEGKTICWK